MAFPPRLLGLGLGLGLVLVVGIPVWLALLPRRDTQRHDTSSERSTPDGIARGPRWRTR